MVRLRCIVEIEGLLTLVTQVVQQTNCRGTQGGTCECTEDIFDLLFHAGLSLIWQICLIGLIRPILTSFSLLCSQGSRSSRETVFRRFGRSSLCATPWAFRTAGKAENLTHQSDLTDLTDA